MKDGWWSLLYGEHHFLFRSWRRKLQEAGIVDMKLLAVCSTMTATAGEINLISKWFAMIACSALLENWSSINLVWEGREDCVWRECLVTRICTYTWTSRWSLVWFIEVLFCEVKSYSFWVVIVGGMSVVVSHSVGWVWWGRLFFGCSSLWLCVIYVLHIVIYIL